MQDETQDETQDDYDRRMKREQAFFEGKSAYSNLPDINQYWASRYLQPRVREVFGTKNHIDFYVQPIAARAKEVSSVRVLSIGTGNGRMERSILSALENQGIRNISLTGLEFSATLVQSTNEETAALGLNDRLTFTTGDFNEMNLEKDWDFIIANQILHHVTNLEGLFDEIGRGLRRGGLLMTRDAIGMNGHQAWPECREIIDDIWITMPERYKFNHRRNKVFETFPNLDLSENSFEGVRAQDILPLMVNRFSFTHFYAYGGITERFLNRGFGPNLDAENPEDKAFVSQLELINDLAIDTGRIKPTQMLGYAGTRRSRTRTWKNRTPKFCIRATESQPQPAGVRQKLNYWLSP